MRENSSLQIHLAIAVVEMYCHWQSVALGGTPVIAQASYDLAGYLKKGEGNIDTDVNIAKLAHCEVGAGAGN